MPVAEHTFRDLLLADLQGRQPDVVASDARRLLVVAGAGSGKTEVMARRVAWWTAVDGVAKDAVVAFTFTDRAAEEMKFRIRQWLDAVTPEGEDATLGGMYVGTIHSYCLKLLRDLDPEEYHNYDVVDEVARVGIVQRGYDYLFGLRQLQQALAERSTSGYMSRLRTITLFLDAYDLLHEYDEFDVELPPLDERPALGREEEWCKAAALRSDVGETDVAQAFAVSAARLYAYYRCRRFLDFSTSQSEVTGVLSRNPDLTEDLRERVSHVVVDEVQDVNPVQSRIVSELVGTTGNLTAVGDHRQAIFGWRGSSVEIMGELASDLDAEDDGEVLELTHNFRSTPTIIKLSNLWNRAITPPGSMPSPDMEHGRSGRLHAEPSHVATLHFQNRAGEADWIAGAIRALVQDDDQGAFHDTREGSRGLTLSDVAVLVRSSTDVRTYMTTLRRHGIQTVVRAGPDLFSQPEVLLLAGVLALTADMTEFLGSQHQRKSLPRRVQDVLGCDPEPVSVVHAACAALQSEGVPLASDVDDRIIRAGELIRGRIAGEDVDPAAIATLTNPELRDWLSGSNELRRVFPQSIFHNLLAEIGVDAWDQQTGRPASAMFHLGQLSSLVTGIETPGWTSARQYRWQIGALLLWGAQNARVEAAPLLVSPDAVTITTVHTAKGLEFPAVFLADVCAHRFPSANRARDLPFDGPITDRIDPVDPEGERRLMYVALTRAERYLFVTASGSRRSSFFRMIGDAGGDALVTAAGGLAEPAPASTPNGIEYHTSERSRDARLVTSFSDLRYFIECPHDFYLRKVLGFAPTIDQVFGYGRGVHNLLRQIHEEPKSWADIASDRSAVEERLWSLVGRGLFYLRHTVGEPADRMRARAVEIVADYVQTYADELATLDFEPEREFETLIDEEGVLVSGAIDLVRTEIPPHVDILDFKSGRPESDARLTLDEDEMRLQVSVYGLAAKHELEYEPDKGLVRYVGDGKEIEIQLTDEALAQAREEVAGVAREIRSGRFFVDGPTRPPRDPKHTTRCGECDFRGICGMKAAREARRPRRRRGNRA